MQDFDFKNTFASINVISGLGASQSINISSDLENKN